MKFEDITDWWENLEAESGYISQLAKRIGSFIEAAESQPEDFKLQTFASLLNRDRDSYALLMKHNPEWRADIQKNVYGRKWDWGQDQVAKLLGYQNPVDMFKRGEDGNPDWYKLIGNEKDPSKALDKYYAEEEGLESNGKLYKWLETAQKQYDNQAKYTGGAVNATRGVFAPRVQEALARSGDYEMKDILGDVGENVLQAAPWARILAKGGKALLGAKSLGKYLSPTPVQIGEYIASNSVAPLAAEVYDANVYNDFENPYRSSFDIGDVISGATTNMTTAPLIGASASGVANAAGVDGIGRKTVRDILSSDPYVTSTHRLEKLNTSTPFAAGTSPSKESLKAEIYAKVFGYPTKKIKEAGKNQRSKWEEGLGIKNITTGDLEKDYTELSRLIETEGRSMTPERIRALENIKENMETMRYKPEGRKQTSYEEYLKNREHMTPTAILEDQGLGGNYGVFGDELADVGTIASNPAAVHQLSAVTTSNQSASRLKKGEMLKASHDKTYPVKETKFDELVKALEDDPVIKDLATSKNLKKPMLSGYVTNKLGRQEFGEKLTGKDLTVSGNDKEVAGILNDNAIIRMWEEGFVPHRNDNDPMWKAYLIYKDNKEKGVKPGKKAGL